MSSRTTKLALERTTRPWPILEAQLQLSATLRLVQPSMRPTPALTTCGLLASYVCGIAWRPRSGKPFFGTFSRLEFTSCFFFLRFLHFFLVLPSCRAPSDRHAA